MSLPGGEQFDAALAHIEAGHLAAELRLEIFSAEMELSERHPNLEELYFRVAFKHDEIREMSGSMLDALMLPLRILALKHRLAQCEALSAAAQKLLDDDESPNAKDSKNG